MSQHKKSWILVKGSEYNPERTLSLGQILTDPFQPDIPLLPDGPLPIPKDCIEYSYQDGAMNNSGDSLDTSFGIWADVLAPVKAEFGGNRTKSNSLSWNFDRIEGQKFAPRIQYVTEALQSEGVVAHMKRSRFSFRKRLYMVMGVRIARGARLSDERNRGYGLNAELSVDGPALGVPISLGISGGFSQSSGSVNSFQGASDFVYAFGLSEIYYGKNVYLKPHTRGETFGLDYGEEDMTTDEGGEDEEEETRIVVEGLSAVDYDGGGRLRQVELPGIADEGFYIPA